MFIGRRTISGILAFLLLASSLQFLPEAFSLYENNELRNIIPEEYSIRTDSALLNLAPENISYNPDATRVMIKGSGDLKELSEHLNVYHRIDTNDGYIAFATTTNDALPMINAAGFEVIRDLKLEFNEIKGTMRLGQILGSEEASKDLGLTGKGVRVAIVDTGTDFSNKDLMHAVARDANGKPIMLDADGQGIVLSKTKFKANITPGGNLLNSTLSDDVDEFTSNVFLNDEGVFLNLVRKGNGTKFEVYNSIYPLISPLVLNATSNNNWKIGESNTDFIRSMSGEYRMGFMLQIQFHLGRAGLIIVPVLVVDSEKAGIYDTIIADMSSSWADFNRFELGNSPEEAEFDYSFTDEKRIKIGNNNEFLTYDADDDGNVDLSAGTVGAHVLDVWGAMNETKMAQVDFYLGAYNGTLLKPMDPDGNYFGVMFDFLGHGTGSAGSVASRGYDSYDVYDNSTEYRLKGVAPDAKIIPVKALWYGDVVYGWFWVSGFDQDEKGEWVYSGEHRADIINNSWGVSQFPVLDYGPGHDVLSLLSSLLSVPGSLHESYPGVLMINSAGNTGFGYGTIGPPSSSPFGLSVGATTNNVFIGYEFTKNEPRFGNSTIYYDDIAEFSSRGPSSLGDVKPELMSIGAYGFVPMPPNAKHATNSTNAFGMFGGTSMAAPLTAGTAAILIEALENEGIDADPFSVKSILMSNADDMRSDPFTQGSGRVNAANAADYVKGENGRFWVYTEDSYSELSELLNEILEDYEIKALSNRTIDLPAGNQTVNIPEGNFTLAFPDKNLRDSKWFAGYVNPGEGKQTTFTVVNRSDRNLTVTVQPTMLELLSQFTINGTTDVREKDPVLNGNDTGYAPNYVRFEDNMKIPEDAELMVAKAYFPFESFHNATTGIYANSLRIASLYFYDWDDMNRDDEVTFDELSMVNRGGAWGTVQEVTVREPLQRVRNTPLIGVYPVPTIFSYWNGDTRQNSTAMNYTLTVSFYKKSDWDFVSIDKDSLELQGKGNGMFSASLNVTENMTPGIYQGFITVTSGTQTTNVPVSFIVPISISDKDIPIVVSGTPRGDLLYDNSVVMGSFDMVSRYNAGDWRFYYFNITDPTINALNMKITWKNNWTSINAMITDPSGKIVASSVPAGVFKVFLGWPSNDWLGTTGFSQGGGFYPAANYGSNATVIYVPINSTGIHTLLLHNTLFHGEELIEPVTIELKSTTLLPDTQVPVVNVQIPEYIRGVVEIPAEITDENLEHVTFTINGDEPVEVGENGTIKLDTTNMVEGFHRLSITASDSVGHRIFKDVFFAVDNTKPELRVRSPESGSVVTGIVDVSMEVFDSTLREFRVILPNGTSIENNRQFSIDASSLSDGTYELHMQAEDGAGNTAEQTIPVTVDNTSPEVSINFPEDGSEVSGVLNIQYDVKEENLRSVLLNMGGRSVEIGDSGSYSVDSSTLFDDEYTLEIVAEDMAGNRASSSVNVSTSNFGPMLQNMQLMGILLGIVIGAGVTAAVLLAAYRKRRTAEVNYNE